jgi:hypothetical protein
VSVSGIGAGCAPAVTLPEAEVGVEPVPAVLGQDAAPRTVPAEVVPPE